MKKTTASLCLLISLASVLVLAGRDPVDPHEGYDRIASKFSNETSKYVLSPVARGHRKITSRPVRIGVINFSNNLCDVVSFGNNVLRPDAKRASEDLVRVGVNTISDLGGLIDVAGIGGVLSNKNTPDGTFVSWGWRNSSYFVVLLLGPSTVHDTIGNAITTVYPVKNAVSHVRVGRWGTIGLQAINTREELLDLTDSPEGVTTDKYSYTRDLYMKVRTQQAGGTLP